MIGMSTLRERGGERECVYVCERKEDGGGKTGRERGRESARACV